MADDLDASRARLWDRRSFERALHDGVQQDLIALCVRVQLLRDAVAREPGAVPGLLDELERDAREALERIRALAAEIYPAILDLRGLPDALHELADGASASLSTTGVERHSADVEAAVYFFCRALAGPGARIRLTEDAEVLRLELDGATTQLSPDVRELVESVGGTVHTDGTVRASIPRRQSTFAR